MHDQKAMTLTEIVRYSPGIHGETFGLDFRNDCTRHHPLFPFTGSCRLRRVR
jgi:hypothetical protein